MWADGSRFETTCQKFQAIPLRTYLCTSDRARGSLGLSSLPRVDFGEEPRKVGDEPKTFNVRVKNAIHQPPWPLHQPTYTHKYQGRRPW